MFIFNDISEGKSPSSIRGSPYSIKEKTSERI
jgi:hypothetical protein